MALDEAPLTNMVGDEDHTEIDPKTDVLVEPSTTALIAKVQDAIKQDKDHHVGAFKRMRRDMHIAKYGAPPEYPVKHYRANLAGRHVKVKTAALYAKNPKAKAARRETLDFAIWDENPQSLMLAYQTVEQMAQAQAMQQQQAAASMDPMAAMTGMAPPPPPPIDPAMMEAATQAQGILEDFTTGMQRREAAKKQGKTLEILFSYFMREQKPVDFKKGAKQMVRRASTTGVGYCKLDFQREMGPSPVTESKLADFRARLDHLKRLAEYADAGDIQVEDAEMAELEASIASLQAEQEIVLREGLIFGFPQSTRVIPDLMTTQLEGFVSARRLTIEYLFTSDQVEEQFGVKLGTNYRGYSLNGNVGTEAASLNKVKDDDEVEGEAKPYGQGQGLVVVWEHYDKASGLVYWTADGVKEWLREPAAPDVFVEDFWPVYALTFNANEHENELFPRSDVALLEDMQDAYNQARQGQREHRTAARPRWVGSRGAFDEDDTKKLAELRPFEVAMLNIDPGTKIEDILRPVPIPGVDPNLYEVGPTFNDVQLVVGSSEAAFGGTSQATATEVAVAANSSTSSDGSSIDDLDGFLSALARAAGQIMQREMSQEQVLKIVGPGAVWPEQTLAEIADELFLEVEAGSTGKPNQAVEMANWEKMLPFLIQMPGIEPSWLARETLRRLDDKLDLTDALASGIPSIVMQNRMAQAGTGDPATDPTAQGGEGAANGPQPQAADGSTAPMGNNQV